jgi:hypothetical protein
MKRIQVVYVSRREDQVQLCGGGKPVKVTRFNEAMSLHEAGVGGVVHGVV